MKKLNSFKDLGYIFPVDHKSEHNKELKKILVYQKHEIEAHYSKKGRAGKPVIILKGFEYSNIKQVKVLAKKIQRSLGVGGSVKKNEIIIQGDKRKELKKILNKRGFKIKFVGG